MNYTKILESMGLSKSLAKLYLLNLKLGPSSAIQMAQKSGITRQMVYTLLPSLMEEGLVKQVTIGGKKYFQAVSPEILNDKVKEIGKKVKELVPLLKSKEAIFNSLPVLSVYENPISMREWYRNFMKEAKRGEEMLIWATNQDWLRLDPEFYREFIEFKKKKEIRDRVIAPDTLASREFEKRLASPFARYRYTKNSWQTDAEKWVWRDSIVYLTINENATNFIVVDASQLAAIERFSFEEIWSNLPAK